MVAQRAELKSRLAAQPQKSYRTMSGREKMQALDDLWATEQQKRAASKAGADVCRA